MVQERSLTGSRLALSSLEQNIPGFGLIFVLMNLVFSVSFGLREEEVWGTSGRLAIAPVGLTTVLGGKLLARLVIGTAQLLVLLLFGHLVYGLTLGRSPLLLGLVAVAIVFSMASFSLIVAAFARTREQIIPVGLSVVFLLAALGGLWWPFYDQPPWMQTIARGAMTTWSMFAIQDVMLRDKGWSDLAPTLLLLIVYGSVSFGLGLRLFRYGERGAS
jgi:ABC-2 type transport system permease protein